MNRPCRFCKRELVHSFADLGMSPLSNSFLQADQLHEQEAFYPLHAYVCENCLLVQLEEFETPENIFSDYLYFSSFSDSWLEHARLYTAMIANRLGLNETSQVLEIASNDGYLLQYFLPLNVPVLGIEPAKNVADYARQKGIETISSFFGVELASTLVADNRRPDLIIANNVLAHVPDLNDFIAGLKILLQSTGTITVEFPHLLELIRHSQFDTIYHEHFSYFSLLALNEIFKHHQLKIYDVESLPTHGGSLRIYATHSENEKIAVENEVAKIIQSEVSVGLDKLDTYTNFHQKIENVRRELLAFLTDKKAKGQSVVAYGAPAKGNTLLNYCGISTDLLPYTVDRSPHKQGRYLPGTHIPVHAVEKIAETQPDYVLLLPWNIQRELRQQLSYIGDWGGRLVVPIPETTVLE